jgi:hypothetical protein
MTLRPSFRLLAQFLPALLVLAGGLTSGVPARAAEDARKAFDIPAGDALVALKQFTAQSGAQVLYSADELTGLKTRAIRGRFSPREALDALVAGQRLDVTQDGATGVLTIRVRAASSATASSRGAAAVAAGGWGTVSGRVSSAATGEFLEGAEVRVIGTDLVTSTQRAGAFALSRVPAGVHRLRVFYTGLDVQEAEVLVKAGEAAVLAVSLNAAVYRLDSFVVAGQREGNAAAITRQRTAENIKSVVSMDAYGNVADGNIGNFLQNLTGVAEQGGGRRRRHRPPRRAPGTQFGHARRHPHRRCGGWLYAPGRPGGVDRPDPSRLHQGNRGDQGQYAGPVGGLPRRHGESRDQVRV